MKEINLVSMNTDQYHYFYKDFDKKIIEREHKKITNQYFKIKTGIKELDYILHGGPGGGEVWMLMGDAKSGKSLGLIHFGIQAVKRFIPVLHFQLEGKIDEATDRYDSAYLGAKYDDVVMNEIPDEDSHPNDAPHWVASGDLIILPVAKRKPKKTKCI